MGSEKKSIALVWSGKIEVTWVTYLTFAFVMTCVTLTFL
jgi:hypothetical protein